MERWKTSDISLSKKIWLCTFNRARIQKKSVRNRIMASLESKGRKFYWFRISWNSKSNIPFVAVEADSAEQAREIVDRHDMCDEMNCMSDVPEYAPLESLDRKRWCGSVLIVNNDGQDMIWDKWALKSQMLGNIYDDEDRVFFQRKVYLCFTLNDKTRVERDRFAEFILLKSPTSLHEMVLADELSNAAWRYGIFTPQVVAAENVEDDVINGEHAFGAPYTLTEIVFDSPCAVWQGKQPHLHNLFVINGLYSSYWIDEHHPFHNVPWNAGWVACRDVLTLFPFNNTN